MEKNKKKISLLILIIGLVLILVIGIISFLINKNKTDNEKLGNINVHLSLEGTGQQSIDEQIRKSLENGKHKLEDAQVYVNPYGSSPLSALITFYTESEESVEVIIKGKNNNDLKLNYDEKTNYHYVPVFGLYADYENSITIKVSDGNSETVKIKTDAIDDRKLLASEQYSDEIKDDIYLITSPLSMSSYAFDAYGNIRWYVDSYYHNIEKLDNGHMLIGNNSLNDSGLSSELYEIDYLGRVYKKYTIEEGYLNDIFIKENGNILLASKNKDRETYSDVIIEIDKDTGKIVKSIDIYDLFSKIDSNFTSNLAMDFFYNSGINYNEKTDTLLLTYWGGEFVISLDYSDSSINWIFSNPANFSTEFASHLLTLSNGSYPKAMHSASLDGNILKVLDNGYSTNAKNEIISSLKGSYSSANTYEISGKNIILKTSLDEDKNNFSYALGDYEVSKDSEVVLFGRELKNVDYNIEKNINEHSDLSTKLIEYKDSKKLFEIEFEGASYSVTKINLNKDYKFDFVDVVEYTTLTVAEGKTLTKDIIDLVNNTTETSEFGFGYYERILENNIMFMDSDEADLVLIDVNNEGIVYNLKDKDQVKVSKILTDIKSGKYAIYVILNGTCYNTNQFIDVK